MYWCSIVHIVHICQPSNSLSGSWFAWQPEPKSMMARLPVFKFTKMFSSLMSLMVIMREARSMRVDMRRWWGLGVNMSVGDEYEDWGQIWGLGVNMRAMVACEPHFCPLSWSQHAAPNATVYKNTFKNGKTNPWNFQDTFCCQTLLWRWLMFLQKVVLKLARHISECWKCNSILKLIWQKNLCDIVSSNPIFLSFVFLSVCLFVF